MAKERRKRERRSGHDRRAVATSATDMVREDHRRLQALFEDFDEKKDLDLRTQIRDALIAEVRTHKVLVEEQFYPAAKLVIKDEQLFEDARTDLDDLEPLLESIEASSPEDRDFEAHWDKLLREMAHHMEWEEQEIVGKVEESELDLITLGLRMAQLKREVLSEQPILPWNAAPRVEPQAEG